MLIIPTVVHMHNNTPAMRKYLIYGIDAFNAIHLIFPSAFFIVLISFEIT